MWSYLAALWWGGDPDEPHTQTNMSRRDMYNVHKTWAVIYNNAHENGFLIFTRIFEADVETKSFFKFLDGATHSDMATSVVFRAHIANLMSALDVTVRHLSTPEVAAQLMRKVGTSHHARHIRRKHFHVFREVVLEIVQKDLALKADVLVSWERFLDFCFRHIFETLTE